MSRCKYCHASIIWVQKPGGAWFPPFNALDELQGLKYELSWDDNCNDWTAKPLNRGLVANLSTHTCAERQDVMVRLDEEDEVLETLPPPIIGTLARPKPPAITHNRYINIAKRLMYKCPTCRVEPFEWCHYVTDTKIETTNLHTSRG